MNNLFLELLNISFTSSYIILAITILRACFKRAPKWVFCFLWGIAGLRLILPFKIESKLSLVPSAQPISPTAANGYSLSSELYEIISFIWLAGYWYANGTIILSGNFLFPVAYPFFKPSFLSSKQNSHSPLRDDHSWRLNCGRGYSFLK